MDVRAIKAEDDFYPRPPRGGRRHHHGCSGFRHEISIHALREEGDMLIPYDAEKIQRISIHALREEGDAVPQG